MCDKSVVFTVQMLHIYLLLITITEYCIRFLRCSVAGGQSAFSVEDSWQSQLKPFKEPEGATAVFYFNNANLLTFLPQ